MATFKDLYGTPEPDSSDEPFIYHGEELTDERAEELADETLAELRKRNLTPGRKSLSGAGKHSPKIEFRVPARLRAELDARAAAEGVTPSKLARRALEAYLDHPKAS
ncbi:ribbon-helix-helix protein, CopG family [Nocardia vermiculata]|uniref:Ribbon-helix-helix protein, CopG family n=1 Tax=Nocardia vermiculata TaxID=257274 RepID=A0A846XWL3_9NOCA|nr:ribbon-helix-helix protein, CopG family [Nocardia vermiculata]NKY50075.1 ribbon-helix-helix protein, CopG family [Nocardia vermiculata]